MKTIKFLAIILLVLSTVSCSSDDDANTNENNYVKVGNTTFGMTSATVESSFNRTYIELINKTRYFRILLRWSLAEQRIRRFIRQNIPVCSMGMLH